MALNHIKFRPASMLKQAVLKPGVKLRPVRFGLLKDIKLHMDFSTQTQMYLGLYETETFEACRDMVRRAQWMVDVGAGVGDLSLYFMKQHGAHTVFAFEPRAEQRAGFIDNLEANGWKAADVALSGSFVGAGEGCAPLDEIGLDLGKRGFVKIDVDGAEMDVLRSGTSLLKSGSADFLIEVHGKELEDECIAFLKSHGYKVDIIANAWWRLFVPERRVISHNRWITAVRA